MNIRPNADRIWRNSKLRIVIIGGMSTLRDFRIDYLRQYRQTKMMGIQEDSLLEP